MLNLVSAGADDGCPVLLCHRVDTEHAGDQVRARMLKIGQIPVPLEGCLTVRHFANTLIVMERELG